MAATRAFAIADDQKVGPNTQVTFLGWTVRETAGSTAVYEIRDSTSSGRVLGEISLAANAESKIWLGPDGVHTDGSIYIKKVSGAAAGSVFIR
jgi:hypothetical protein